MWELGGGESIPQEPGPVSRGCWRPLTRLCQEPETVTEQSHFQQLVLILVKFSLCVFLGCS